MNLNVLRNIQIDATYLVTPSLSIVLDNLSYLFMLTITFGKTGGDGAKSASAAALFNLSIVGTRSGACDCF